MLLHPLFVLFLFVFETQRAMNVSFILKAIVTLNFVSPLVLLGPTDGNEPWFESQHLFFPILPGLFSSRQRGFNYDIHSNRLPFGLQNLLIPLSQSPLQLSAPPSLSGLGMRAHRLDIMASNL